MTTSVIICAVTCVVMILSILFFPKLKLGRVSLSLYWVITLLGAAAMLIFKQVDFATVGHALISDDAINPLKILVLFLSMTVLSIYLDELGFFRYLANNILQRAHSGQIKLFAYLYITVSVLTVFTSNDIIILSFTPFICYFAKHAKINPIPYLVAEFVAANTWSMTLVVGNPTNIYLATAYGIDFLTYFKMSALPTVAAGLTAFILLFVVFRKSLKAELNRDTEVVIIEDKPSLIIGIVHLTVSTVLLAISSYIHLEMWLISLCAVGSLFLTTGIAALIRKRAPRHLLGCLKRAPYQLIPFLISMFVMIVALKNKGVTEGIADLFGSDLPILKYGTASFFTANLINNIPMSVLFTSILADTDLTSAVYATIIGSNLGALFTPIGSLAGIMWSGILKKHEVKFSFGAFVVIGFLIAVPALFAALGILKLMFLI